MAVNFANVTAITIPQGDVSKITRTSDGVVLWEKKPEIVGLQLDIYFNYANSIISAVAVVAIKYYYYVNLGGGNRARRFISVDNTDGYFIIRDPSMARVSSPYSYNPYTKEWNATLTILKGGKIYIDAYSRKYPNFRASNFIAAQYLA